LPTRSPTLNSQLARSLIALAASFLIVGGSARAAEQSLAASTVVIYNKTASDSAELARFYAKQRGIA